MVKAIFAIFVAAVCLAGCSRQQSSSAPELGGPSGVVTWSASVDVQKPRPGVDQASIYYAGNTFVVWSAFEGGGGSSSSGNMSGVRGQGHLGSRDNGYVEFQFETKDGKTGPVTINEAHYDLKDGGLFLAATHSDQLVVKQLKRDLRDLKFERESLGAFCGNDADITAFFDGRE